MPEQPKAESAAKPKATAQAKARRTARSRGRRSTLVLLLVGLAFVAVLFAFVYPTRTYLRQRQDLNTAERRLQVLEQSTKALEHDSDRLETDAEVERRAREDYGLVRPGETPYVLVPTPATTPSTTLAP
jgi:cell division protein FtsB